MLQNPHWHFSSWQRIAAAVVLVAIIGITIFALKSAAPPDPTQGMTVFAEYCAVCHGAAGQGLFGTPPLDDPKVRAKSSDELRDTLARGCDDTAMIAYSKAYGGKLNERDLDNLVTMIQQSDWAAVSVRVDALGFTPPTVFLSDLTVEMQDQIKSLPEGAVLIDGLLVYAEHCATCHGGDGGGTVAAPAVNTPDFRADNTADEIRTTINDGVSDTRMAAWSKKLSSEEVNTVLALLMRWDELDALGLDLTITIEPLDLSTADVISGEKLFKTLCTRCHGSRGQGTLIAPKLHDPVFLHDTPPRTLYEIINLGVPDTLMAGWSGYLEDQKILNLVTYLQSWADSSGSLN